MCFVREYKCSITQKTSLLQPGLQPGSCSLLSRKCSTWPQFRLAINWKSSVFHGCQVMLYFGSRAVRHYSSGRAFGAQTDGCCGVHVDSNRAQQVYFCRCTYFIEISQKWNKRQYQLASISIRKRAPTRSCKDYVIKQKQKCCYCTPHFWHVSLNTASITCKSVSKRWRWGVFQMTAAVSQKFYI